MSRTLLCSHILQIKNSRVLNFSVKNIKHKDNIFKQCGVLIGNPIHRLLSGIKYDEDNTSFSQFINFRKEEAKRSIIVQVQSAHSYKELYSYCNQIGSVNQMFHYTSGVEPLHFILVEFESNRDVQNILSASCHVEDTQVVPVKSPFLWFKVGNKQKSSLKSAKSFKLSAENGTKLPSEKAITEVIKSAESISDQIRIVHEMTKLNDLGIRLRFLTARQIELAITGMFPDAVAYPFGSSINGYGKLGCDLDLILKLTGNRINSTNSRLIYQCKAGFGNERSQSQRHMEAIGDILHLFLPGCSQVRRILQARVPILKYNQQFTDIECDLSMTNMIALRMSEVLYVLGSMDDRVRPLVFTIRKWAQEMGLTNPSPGRWITNFSLTLLVLAFLQRSLKSSPILPSINSLIKIAGEKDINFLENNESVTFLGDLKNVETNKNNTESLESLLMQFFEYYTNFDFMSKGISLNEAAAVTKPEHSPLYIVNPLERGLNVSKNVSIEELERFRFELRNACWILESQGNRTGNWGILQLCYSGRKTFNEFVAVRQGRLMEVKNLFEADNADNVKPETSDVEYKNETIKTEIENIKKETSDNIQPISSKLKIRSLSKRSAGLRRR